MGGKIVFHMKPELVMQIDKWRRYHICNNSTDMISTGLVYYCFQFISVFIVQYRQQILSPWNRCDLYSHLCLLFQFFFTTLYQHTLHHACHNSAAVPFFPFLTSAADALPLRGDARGSCVEAPFCAHVTTMSVRTPAQMC